jgi:hypothetical protein
MLNHYASLIGSFFRLYLLYIGAAVSSYVTGNFRSVDLKRDSRARFLASVFFMDLLYMGLRYRG